MSEMSNASAKQKFYGGTSGIALPVANKLSFPEAFRNEPRLTYYASLFNSIEINSSFKKLPMVRTVEKWAASTPDGFQFTFKFSQVITHNKGLVFNPDDIHRFLQTVSAVGSKKGCLLLQFPGKTTSEYSAQLGKLIKAIKNTKEAKPWKIAVEFRHHSWYQQDVYDLLGANNFALVLHDMPASSPPVNTNTSDFVYLRFHGTEKGYRGSYPDEFLNSYAAHIRQWHSEGKTVYAYFNNTLGEAARNLVTLKESLNV